MLRELTRPVGNQDRDDEVAARRREAEAGHRDERRRVDVASCENGAHRVAAGHETLQAAPRQAPRRRPRPRASSARAASTIAWEIASSSTTTTSSRRSRRIAAVSSAGYFTAMPSAIVGPVGSPPRQRRARGGLNADRATAPAAAPAIRSRSLTQARRLRRGSRPCPDPARKLLGELEAERPLPGDHARVVECVDECRARRLDRGARAAATASSNPSPPSVTIAP